MTLSNIKNYRCALWAVSAIFLLSCGGDKKKEVAEETQKEEKMVDVPQFNADSAYKYIQKQVAFGPRVPNTPAHQKAAEYYVDKLKNFGATVEVQEFEAKTFDNVTLQLKNIIASFDPEKKKRILLAAHWDTRPYADKDSEMPKKPIDGANDGGSGVGVLLEIARVIGANKSPDVGVDIIFFDGEDWGEIENGDTTPLPDTLDSWWCLGSQYWAKNKHKKNYSAYYGILLDMVGAKNAQFPMEGTSLYFASSVVDKIWDRAEKLGHSEYFVRKKPGAITDDHAFVNKYGKIPMVDIVHYSPEHGYFGEFHHTHQDNMDLISEATLNAVGETVLAVLYYE